MKAAERIDLDLEQVDALLKRVETGTLQDGDYQIIKAIPVQIAHGGKVLSEYVRSPFAFNDNISAGN